MQTSYYHLRYNVYEPPGSPVEKERWIKFDKFVDESIIRVDLETKHQNKVSLILCKEICLEEFEQNHLKIS
ncbi:MAG: hypothetical protein EOP48_32725 [Sphingobacteriales bacterium]|nr:MAG: hypothetical protein EOP48_32725 [Sphingobacteriales bacterium]